MTKVNVGASHQRSKVRLRGEFWSNSTAELNIGDSFDDSTQDIHIIETDRAAILDEVAGLRTALDELSQRVPRNPDVQEVSRKAEELAQSATKIVEQRKWYSVSAEGLLEATKALGSVASPLVDRAIKIVELLSKLK